MLKKISYLIVLLLFVGQMVMGQGAASAAAAAGDAKGDAANGETLFKVNCSSCHKPDAKMTGPALKGALGRWGNDPAEMAKFAKDPGKYTGKKAAYVKDLIKEYGTVMQQQGDMDAKKMADIMAYVEAYVPPVAAGGGGDKVGDQPKTGLDGKTAFYVVSIAVGILLVSLLVLIIAIAVVARLVKNQEEGKKVTKADLQDAVLALVKNKFTITVGILVLTVGASNAAWDFLSHINLHDGYQPVQPIRFSHKLHAGKYQIACQYCHVGVERGKSATIPSINICTNCHKKGGVEDGPVYGKTEIAKIFAADSTKKPVEWVRIHNLPDFVYFNHSQHVKVAGLECQECHGPIQEMEEVYQFSRLSMGWCVNCHRKKEVDINKDEYYKSIHKELREHPEQAGKITVEKLGGLECARCHY